MLGAGLGPLKENEKIRAHQQASQGGGDGRHGISH